MRTFTWTRDDTIMLVTMPLWIFPLFAGCVLGIIVFEFMSGWKEIWKWLVKAEKENKKRAKWCEKNY